MTVCDIENLFDYIINDYKDEFTFSGGLTESRIIFTSLIVQHLVLLRVLPMLHTVTSSHAPGVPPCHTRGADTG